ncbi:GNAT family N-acetyltransferase [Saccharicrinis aurantiacus]|uniref:GNAT family N-acetyltransferase n=1 Tax=Saccharicrinis aurantiacus TaxID=1849719 RepID=UPI00248F52F6|nr:GNAT family N-acetyltransferase [Saccharicrinis aurantiacus]
MNFNTDRLKLTEIIWDDLEDIHALQSIFEVDEFNTVGIPKDIEETRNNIKPFIEAKGSSNQSKYTWSIRIPNTDEFIGLAGISLSNDKFRIGQIFYKLHPKFWGKGYATEVSKEIIELGFKHFNLHRIEAGFATENIRSKRVLEKCGMIKEGVYRKILPIRGNWVDSCIYAITEEDIK